MTISIAATPFATIECALEEIRAGRMVVVVDDADRENEGDLTIAAEKVTPAQINFMARHGRGLICAALTPQRLEDLRIPLMTEDNTSNFGTAFCESVDARSGVSTGISAADRAQTIQALVAATTRPGDLARPGHVFPLRADPGGVLARAGQTEAAVDLARMAGLAPAGVICEIMNEDGSMARVSELDRFCQTHALKMITVADLISYRILHERHLERWATAAQETRYGVCQITAYRNRLDGEFHSALVFGDPQWKRPVLIRVQTHCLAAAWGSTECSCAATLDAALRRIEAEGSGVLVYLHQSSPGFQFASPASHSDTPGPRTIAHATGAPRESSHDTTPEGVRELEPSIQRQTGIGAQILADLGVREIRLLTDHPRRLAALSGYGMTVVEQIPLEVS